MHATNTRTDNPQLSAQLFRSILYRSVARTELFTLLHVQHSASWPIWVYCSILLDVLHRRLFLPLLPVLRHNYPVLLKLSHADFNRFFAIDLTCSSCIWLKIEYCFIRIIPDRAENPEGKFFLDTKRIQSNIFIDERYGTVTIQAAEIIIKSFLTFCLPIEFLSSPTCESLSFDVCSSGCSQRKSHSTYASKSIIRRHQESSYSFESVSRWLPELSKQVVFIGSQIHGPSGDASFPLSTYAHINRILYNTTFFAHSY